MKNPSFVRILRTDYDRYQDENRRKIAQYESQIKYLATSGHEVHREIALLYRETAEQNRTISDLHKQVSDLQKQVSDLCAEKKELINLVNQKSSE